MNNDKIVTPSFCYILAANFLLFFAFYLILPILPFYLKEEFMIGKSMIGFILSCYTLAALCIRPFAGYLLDTFARRPLYLVAYFIFTAIFGGYMVATALTLFIALRVVHGFAFGMVTVAGNTILIDILPSSRRGEGIGYYGLANNIAIRADDRSVHARELHIRRDLFLLVAIRKPWFYHGLYGQDSL